MCKKCKSLLIPLMLLAIAFLFCACGAEQNQYDANDEAGYTVSVRFDANGGEFTTNCSVIMDSFNISGMTTNASGNVELALLAPDNSIRGATNTYTVAKNGYFLAGWYATRTETVGSDGNTIQSYADKWDFENRLLEVDPNGTYTSAEPVLTLYAAWIPMYEIQFYNLEDGALLDTYAFNPTSVSSIQTPQWDMETGALQMYKFPKRSGYSFEKAYYDADRASEVGETVEFPTFVAENEITATKTSVAVYVDWREGEWYHIYTAQQLVDNATRNGCFEIHADLDFTGLDWPAMFSYGDFTGTILGNGHTISNVTITQTDNAKTRFGLFGSLADGAVLENVIFENVTATIRAGARTSGIAYGLFAGNIAAGANLSGVQILGSQLQIDSACVLTSNDYVFGLICGMGNYGAVEIAEITAVAVGDNPESVSIQVDPTDGTLEVIIG